MKRYKYSRSNIFELRRYANTMNNSVHDNNEDVPLQIGSLAPLNNWSSCFLIP